MLLNIPYEYGREHSLVIYPLNGHNVVVIFFFEIVNVLRW